MNTEDIIRMAKEAGLVRFEGGELEAYGIAKASLDDHSRACWRIADEQRLKRFAALIAAAEREACAKECEHTAVRMGSEWMAHHCAAAIRARGQS
jgi:hypothetical protein